MSIVSENEMREFFQRLIDSVAELSTQAGRVEGLVQQVQQLTERLDKIAQDNYNLNSQIVEANNTMARMEGDITSTRSQLENEKAVTQGLRETIVARDAGVQSLEQSFRREEDAHKLTTSERDDARQRISELEASLAASKQSYDEVFHDRDNWRQKFWEVEKEAAQVKQQLDKINSVINPLRVVSGDFQTA